MKGTSDKVGGLVSLTPVVKRVKTSRFKTTIVSLLLASGSILGTVAIAAPASATVPNRYYCNPSGGWCYQINGAHDPAVQDQCHWKRSGMSGKPQQLYYTNCDSWGPDVP